MNNLLLKKYVELFKMGQMEVFGIIYLQFKDLISVYMERMKTEDTRQELILTLIEVLNRVKTEKFSDDESDTLRRYILVTLKHKYQSLEKKKLLEQRVMRPFWGGELICDDSFESDIDTYVLLETLSKKQRDVIIYKYFLNFTDVEIAEIMGISRQAVNRIKNRGIESLRFLIDY